MDFIADLHIHSKFSRATAKNLDLENLYIEAQKKGIQAIGTGDSTHPGWFAELKEKLEPAEEGLFRLRESIARPLEKEIPASCRGIVRFMLESEISNIYKKGGATRKNHNLVFFPDFDSAERFNQKLDAIGNIKSDGRPILGLDAKRLLEILLETNPDNFLVPAHIWTPWFSLLGSKSGFDSIDECFEDLTPEIFAVETGLSSDPPMNWRVSNLDRVTLISNSDAHSPAKLGREANLFSTELSFSGIRNALKTGNPETFRGTLEFYPEEGKYHLDGHRKCGVSLNPEQSSRLKGLCPSCGKPLTLGVLYRVNELADRREGEKPARHHPFMSIIPLDEIIAEVLNVGPASKKVRETLKRVIEKNGSEFAILKDIPIEELKKTGVPLLAEGIKKMRENDLHVLPGYDGEFGKVRLFESGEKSALSGQKLLFPFKAASDGPTGYLKAGSEKEQTIHKAKPPAPQKKKPEAEHPREINFLQLQAIEDRSRALLIKAGPGTGKTFTLTQKIARLVQEKAAKAEEVIAITFTRKAALEMAERLHHLLKTQPIPKAQTFHSLCHDLLAEEMAAFDQTFTVIDDMEKRKEIEAVLTDHTYPEPLKAQKMAVWISGFKQRIEGPLDDLSATCREKGISNEPAVRAFYAAFQARMKEKGLLDYDDLIFNVVIRLERDEDYRNRIRDRFRYIFVDEFQDLNPGQHRLITALFGPYNSICVIGDPNQAIYGFRGADATGFETFQKAFPEARVISLEKNYRSTEAILAASFHVIAKGKKSSPADRVYSGIEGVPVIHVTRHPTALSEAVTIGKRIERMIGGTGFHSIDFGKADSATQKETLSFSDFAILVRTIREGREIGAILDKGGIPCEVVHRDQAFSAEGVKRILACLNLLHGKPLSHENGSYPKKGDSDPLISLVSGLSQSLIDQSVKNQILYLAKEAGAIRETLKTRSEKEIVQRIARMAEPFGQNALEFLNAIALYQDSDMIVPELERVSIMTIHAAKGLEFPIVFIPGCENGNIPYQRPGDATVDVEEERRLFYVALTRAKDQLFLSHADKRKRFGKTIHPEISPFVTDIETHLLRKENSQQDREPPLKKPIQLTLF